MLKGKKNKLESCKNDEVEERVKQLLAPQKAKHLKITLLIPEKAISKGRPRFNGFTTFTPKRTKDFEELLSEYYFEARIMQGYFKEGALIQATIQFRFKRGKHKELFCKGRSDIDNLVKAVLDAGNDILYPDDSQIVILQVSKLYDETDSIWIELRGI